MARFRTEYPLDPNCPSVRYFNEDMVPTLQMWGAPVEDFRRDFEKSHSAECSRCHEFGLNNVDVTEED